MNNHELEATSNALDITHDALMEPDIEDATPIDVETYVEYDYTDAEMLDFVFSQEDAAPKRYMAKHAKTGKWAYSDKGPVLSDEQWNALDWYDTFRGAIQAEIKKDSEEKK